MILPSSNHAKPITHDPLTCGLGSQYCPGCAAAGTRVEQEQPHFSQKRMTRLRQWARLFYCSGLTEEDADKRLRLIDKRTTPPRRYAPGESGFVVAQVVRDVFRNAKRFRLAGPYAAERRRTRRLLAKDLPAALRALKGPQ